MIYDLKRIFSNFDIEDEFVSAEPFGRGHINETFLVKSKNNLYGTEKTYILQKINSKLFDVVKLMNNIGAVTSFIYKKLEMEKGDIANKTLRLFFTRSGLPYYYDLESEGYYRLFNYIEGSVAYQIIDSPKIFYEAAKAFGNFANLLSDFDASSLQEVLPNFHNTVKRYENLQKSIREDRFGRVLKVQEEISFVEERKDYCHRIVDLLDSNKMPLRVTHNDTKLNNVLIDGKSGKYLTVIDLDTIMPGSLCYDFGDAIRSGCNTAPEDERKLSEVQFNLELFEAFTKGYFKAIGKSVTQIEKDNFAFSAILMTYECGMRFLTDYIDGDIYFRINRDNQNLDRARAQFKLLTEMEEHLPEMQRIVNKY